MKPNSSRLSTMSWTSALLAIAASWGAPLTDSPWNILLVIFAIACIMVATGTFAISFSRMKSEQGQDR